MVAAMSMAASSAEGTSAANGANDVTKAFKLYTDHFDGHPNSTAVAMLKGLRAMHPGSHVTSISPTEADLLGFATAGHAKATLGTSDDHYHLVREYEAGVGRSVGSLTDKVLFGRYDYVWHERRYVMYHVGWEKVLMGKESMQYLVTPPSAAVDEEGHSSMADKLVLAAAKWGHDLHDQIWVFDDGCWEKSDELWKSVQNSSWDDVILDPTMKESLKSDIEGFFDRQHLYADFGVPWKRGVIFHGEPGNGKTVSLKAVVNGLSKRHPDPIAALYVKSLKETPCEGPEVAVKTIFKFALSQSPCLLIFEDIDSLITDQVRSYFLNEVDGIAGLDGVMIVGSTNHLEKLDPAISKRPSRFDRKYFFSLPGETERRMYCEYWRKKLANKPSIEFAEDLSGAIAKVTEGFSFAYLKELFITSLLILVQEKSNGAQEEAVEEEAVEVKGDEVDSTLMSSALGKVIRSQVEILRKDMSEEESTSEKKPVAATEVAGSKGSEKPCPVQ
ncbi:MAG: hypothetical protein M1823_005726 [Watsoniomyces obsoletus]|nr:MAG: hypothetical protein M1823_005726 [Watsoniomyces obsoletus]